LVSLLVTLIEVSFFLFLVLLDLSKVECMVRIYQSVDKVLNHRDSIHTGLEGDLHLDPHHFIASYTRRFEMNGLQMGMISSTLMAEMSASMLKLFMTNGSSDSEISF
jgi:hypothetical protein